MATITVRNVEDETKSRLRVRAARNGVSLEEEVRSILRREARETGNRGGVDNLYDAIRELVEPHGGFEIDIPERSFARRDPPFTEWT